MPRSGLVESRDNLEIPFAQGQRAAGYFLPGLGWRVMEFESPHSQVVSTAIITG